MAFSEDRLSFIVRFVRMDLTQLRQTEVERLRGELNDFVKRGPGPTHKKKAQSWTINGLLMPVYLEPLTAKKLVDLQQEVKNLLTNVLRREKTPAGMYGIVTPPRQLPVSYQLWGTNHARFLNIGGPLPDVVLVILHLL